MSDVRKRLARIIAEHEAEPGTPVEETDLVLADRILALLASSGETEASALADAIRTLEAIRDYGSSYDGPIDGLTVADFIRTYPDLFTKDQATIAHEALERLATREPT